MGQALVPVQTVVKMSGDVVAPAGAVGWVAGQMQAALAQAACLFEVVGVATAPVQVVAMVQAAVVQAAMMQMSAQFVRPAHGLLELGWVAAVPAELACASCPDQTP